MKFRTKVGVIALALTAVVISAFAGAAQAAEVRVPGSFSKGCSPAATNCPAT